VLAGGSTFQLDVTALIQSLIVPSPPQVTNAIGVAVSSGSGPFHFFNVGARVTGTASTGAINNEFIGLWSSGALTASGVTNFSATNPNPGGVFRLASFDLTGPTASAGGIFASAFAPPVSLTSVTSFVIEGTYVGGGDGVFNLGIASVPFTSFPGGVGSPATPFDLFTANGGNPPSVYGGFFQLTPAQAPAPLPLLGVGVAFGWSRSLRRRIKAANQPVAMV
jgi:hypothetical protein